jgi:purine-cytosine permease-like protein
MVFGAVFLLAFAGGLASLYSMRPEWVTTDGMRNLLMRMKIGLWTMAVIAWATVITGTYIVYPWYRSREPNSARSLLLANPTTAEWHNFGMEWKEHVGWLAPIAATVVAFVISYYGPTLARRTGERRAVMIFFVASFLTAAAAGLLGAFLNKVAPIR